MALNKEGVYIPPFRLAQMRDQIEDKSSETYQKLMWDLLRKSLNGIINKANISNLPKIIFELFNENLLRGRGLLCKSLLQGQLAAPNFTNVYAAIIAVVNTKLPEIGLLIVHRLIKQFQRSYKMSEKLTCVSSLKFIAHLFNQQVIHELLPLQVAALLIEQATEDSIEIVCDFLIECGQVLSDVSPLGTNAIFEKLRSILQEGTTSKRVQYTIEHLLNVRKEKFKDNPGVLQQLDLVEENDRVTHEVALDENLNLQENFNIFRVDKDFLKNEQEWEEIKREILGDDESEEEEPEEQEEQKKVLIKDMTDADTVNLRKMIYLNVMSSVDFEECANKMLKLKIRPGQEIEVAHMLIECCMHERSYLRFYGLLAERFSILNPMYKDFLEDEFVKIYSTIDRYETNKLRNVAKFFAHLLFTDAITWGVMKVIELSEDTTTSSSRIFIKILMQEIAENMGSENMLLRFKDIELEGCFDGLFLKDIPKNTRFCINFFTSIGLGELTEDLRKHLETFPAQAEEPSDGTEESDESESSELPAPNLQNPSNPVNPTNIKKIKQSPNMSIDSASSSKVSSKSSRSSSSQSSGSKRSGSSSSNSSSSGSSSSGSSGSSSSGSSHSSHSSNNSKKSKSSSSSVSSAARRPRSPAKVQGQRGRRREVNEREGNWRRRERSRTPERYKRSPHDRRRENYRRNYDRDHPRRENRRRD